MQVLGGGVVVLIAVLLWLAYLLPSWHARHQFNATERNAVRLSQALRILAETSAQPDEVRIELDTRHARRQAKLARRAEATRNRLAAAEQRAAEEAMRDTAAFEKERLRASVAEAREVQRAQLVSEQSLHKARAQAARAHADAEMAVERERLRREREQARRAPAVVAARQARARRAVRLGALALLVAGIALSASGLAGSLTLMAVAGVVVAMLAVTVLQRMARVARRAHHVVNEPAVIEAAPRARVSVLHDEPAPRWTPRSLPQPMTSVAGSRAAVAQDAADAREALRRAALDEAARQRATELAPVRLQPAALHHTDDAGIEAHVRQLLAQRAAG